MMIINLNDGKFIKVDIKKNEKGVYEYYSEGILLGVFDPKVMNNSKFLEIDLEKNNTIKNELSADIKDNIKQIIDKIKENIETMNFDEIEEEVEENRVLGEYVKKIGINSKKVAEIDIESKNSKEKNKKNGKILEVEKNNKTESIIDASKVDKKQEISLGERATDRQNFKRWLEVKSGKTLPEGAMKIAVISSDDMRQMKDEKGKTIDNSSTQYGLAIIKKDENGKMVAEPLKKYIPQLEQSHNSGTNPIKAKNQIQTNGEVEKDPVLSEYRIGRAIIDMDKDHMDDMEVHLGEYGPHTNESTRVEIRDNNTTFATDTPARAAVLKYTGGVHQGEKSNKELEECNESKKDYRDADGDPTTKSDNHNHEIAKKILNTNVNESNDEKLSDFYNESDAIKHFNNIAKDNPNLNEEQIAEKAIEELRNTASAEHEIGPQNKQ